VPLLVLLLPIACLLQAVVSISLQLISLRDPIFLNHLPVG
jgi:hypothetical protein